MPELFGSSTFAAAAVFVAAACAVVVYCWRTRCHCKSWFTLTVDGTSRFDENLQQFVTPRIRHCIHGHEKEVDYMFTSYPITYPPHTRRGRAKAER